MLHFFRSKASSWLMKIILGLILLSFGLWGISGIFAGRANQQIVAKVGEVQIGKDYFLHVLQQRVRDANKALKGSASFTLEQAISLGIHKVLLNEIISKTLLDIESKDLKLTTDLSSIKALIKSDPVFLDKNGKFDRDKYEDLLKRSGITEEQLVHDKQKSLINMQLLSSVTALSNIPATLSIEMFRMMSEQRYLKVYEIDAIQIAKQKDFKAMTISDSDLEKHYNANKEAYRVPEKRRGTILIINANKISKKYKFTKDEIQQAYEEKIGDYAVLEKRDITIWTAHDKKSAEALLQDINKKRYKKHKNTETPMSNITQDDLQDSVADAAFNVDTPTVVGPVKTEDGFQIIRINKIKPSRTQPLREVKAQVIDDLKQQKLTEDIANLTQQIEDEVSGGSTLEEIARNHELQIVHSGFFSKHEHAKAPQVSAEMVKAAFDQSTGEDGPVIEVNQNMLFIMRVDEIKEDHIPELSEIKQTIKDDITKLKALQKAKNIAKQLKESKSNASIDTIVRKNSFVKSKSYPWVNMQTITKTKLNPRIVEKAFSQRKGSKEIVDLDTSVYVIETIDTQPVEVESNLRGYKDMKNTLMEVLNQDIFAQYMEALKVKHGVEIYDEEMNTLLS